MSIETITQYLLEYGYGIIFLFLFLGIVGIPAPEESLLFLIGVLIWKQHLSPELAAMSGILGAFTGMLAAYACARYLGKPFLYKYGKYVGLTAERWERAAKKSILQSPKIILLGYYMPGIRQISPYFAGVNHFPFPAFALLSFAGALLWILPFIAGGYLLGRIFHISPSVASYLGFIFLAIFLAYLLYRYVRRRRNRGGQNQ